MASVVIDANVGIALVLRLPYSDLAEQAWAQWQRERARILVPCLWQYEVVSTLRKASTQELLSAQDTTTALDLLFSLGAVSVEPSLEQHRLALNWAKRLSQKVAYDAQYLALAEQTGAQLWTADRSLAHRAREAGATWVSWLGER